VQGRLLLASKATFSKLRSPCDLGDLVVISISGALYQTSVTTAMVLAEAFSEMYQREKIDSKNRVDTLKTRESMKQKEMRYRLNDWLFWHSV